MPAKRKAPVITSLLVSSVVATVALGLYILATDEHIWEDAPSHAYGLAAFTGVYAFLLGLLKFRTNIAMKGIFIMALIQFASMNLDMLTTENIPVFQVQGMEFDDLLEHLYGSWYFDVLLGFQALMIVIGVRSSGVLQVVSRNNTLSKV